MIEKYCSNKSSKIVYLMGIDGSGKTTLSKVLTGCLLKSGIKACAIWFGFKEFHIIYVVKFMKLILGSQRASKMINLHAPIHRNEPVKAKFISRLIYLVYFVFVMIDYLIWYRITLRKYKNCVIIADRYIFDMFVAMSTVYGNEELLYILYNLLKKFITKPTMVVYINVPPCEALKRKPEKPLNILKSQKRIYDILISLMREEGYKIVVIDGLKPLNKKVVNLLNIITDLAR